MTIFNVNDVYRVWNGSRTTSYVHVVERVWNVNGELRAYFKKPTPFVTYITKRDVSSDVAEYLGRMEIPVVYRTPRKHAELIKKWANDNSVEIEFYNKRTSRWTVNSHPRWDADTEYRIKPSEVAREEIKKKCIELKNQMGKLEKELCALEKEIS